MKKKERLKEKGIEIIGKEMWAWYTGNEKYAKKKFVILSRLSNKSDKYLVIGTDNDTFWISNASETNPNEVKFKVGDKVKVAKMLGKEGFFWYTELNDTLGEIGVVSEISDNGDKINVKISDTEYTYLNESLELVDDSPKVGDVGYFWDEENKHRIMYGKLTNIIDVEYRYVLGKVGNEGFENFSKTPPEIK